MLIISAPGVATKKRYICPTEKRYICPTDANELPHPGFRQKNANITRAADVINAAAILPKTI
jgi:hypothetical protein